MKLKEKPAGNHKQASKRILQKLKKLSKLKSLRISSNFHFYHPASFKSQARDQKHQPNADHSEEIKLFSGVRKREKKSEEDPTLRENKIEDSI